MEALLKENEELRKENEELRQQLKQLKQLQEDHKQYSQNVVDSKRKYYESNKEIVKEKALHRLKKLAEDNPEKIKEYRRNAYLKRKEKLEKEKIKAN
jgi:hypothetical protein